MAWYRAVSSRAALPIVCVHQFFEVVKMAARPSGARFLLLEFLVQQEGLFKKSH